MCFWPPYSKFKDIIEEFMRQKLSQLHEWGVLTNILISVIRKDTTLSFNVLKWVVHVSPCRQEACIMRILGREAKLEKNYNTKLVWCWEVGCNTMWQTLSQLLFFRAWAQQESIFWPCIPSVQYGCCFPPYQLQQEFRWQATARESEKWRQESLGELWKECVYISFHII